MILTASSHATPASDVLTRLAERWRTVGLFVANLDRDGHLLWYDPQMPRMLSMCLTVDSVIPQQVKRVGEAVTTDGVRVHAQLPWIQMQLVPIMKRRKVSGWVAFIGRTDQVVAASEELARFAQRAHMYAEALTSLSQRVPLVPVGLFGPLARVAEIMHEGPAGELGDDRGAGECHRAAFERV